jgi:hypothetical protein
MRRRALLLPLSPTLSHAARGEGAGKALVSAFIGPFYLQSTAIAFSGVSH